MDPILQLTAKTFPEPFAYVIYNYQVEHYCSYCLQRPRRGHKLLVCSGCHWFRYCGKNCQRGAWRDHKLECERLRTSFPHLPLTEVLFLGRVVDKLNFIQEHGDAHRWQAQRPFDDLMTHEQDVLADSVKMNQFDAVYDKAQRFLSYHMPPKERFFTIFCKTCINSHTIHSNSGAEIGMALDLGISKYDHSCFPNTVLVFNGFQAVLRPLAPGVDVNDPTKAFIAYVDVVRSKYQRRKELLEKWYFWCECKRCQSDEDDRLTSIRCPNGSCLAPVVITEETKPAKQDCSVCGAKISPDYILNAQAFMKALPKTFTFHSDPDEVKKLKIYLDNAKKLLHPVNIYYCRLLTAYMQVCPDKDQSPDHLDSLRRVCEIYKRCLPAMDRHIGFQLLHIVRALIEKKQRNEAITYAFEAMQIFEVSLGMDHPYYLQTLALWTFLDNKAKKTDQELLNLMNFNYNRPINLTAILEKVQSLGL